MIKGIVFDLDGTLVDSLSATFEAFNYGITQLGGRRHTPEEIMKYFGPGEREIFAKIVGPDQALDAYKAARTYMDAHMGEVPLHDGISELLDSIRSAGIPTSIFTGRSWDTTQMILDHHHLRDRFITIVANDHVNSPKPSPEGLYLAVSRMKLNPEDVLFVGDSSVDMVASRIAKTQGVAALWDLLAKRELLAPHTPAHWASHPRDVWEICNV